MGKVILNGTEYMGGGGSSGGTPTAEVLWEGTFDRDGSISIQNLDNWLLIGVENDEGIILIGTKSWGHGGYGGYNINTVFNQGYRFNTSVTDTLTIDANNRGFYYNNSTNTHAQGSHTAIKKIYGFIKAPV